MNKCFIIGKIASEIKFEFIINSKNIAIAIFEIELKNKSHAIIKAYNELADYCYRKLTKGDVIVIQGSLNSKMEIIVEEIELN